MKKTTRRQILHQSALVAGVSLGLPWASATAETDSQISTGKLKVMVVGAHPDDPESGCGGTMRRYADLGHEVVAVYFTRGEAGIPGKTYEEAAKIRTAEAENACKILHARPVFFGQIDGNTKTDAETYDAFFQLIDREKPHICFAHWPIDTHRDHRTASLHVYDAWMRSEHSFALYYFEVMTGQQSQNFHPSLFIDITETEAQKREACYAHASQGPDHFYAHHDKMNQFRGYDGGFPYAEAFIPHTQSSQIPL